MTDDTTDDGVKTLFTGAEGPPLGFGAADIIERGGRLRRRRKRLAVLGSSMTTVAAIVVIALASVHHADRPAPIEPAGPGLSIETVTPTPTPLDQAPAEQETPGRTAPPVAVPASTGKPAAPPQADPEVEASKSKAKADADAKVRPGISRLTAPAPPSTTP
jgi:hypothetical protein